VWFEDYAVNRICLISADSTSMLRPANDSAPAGGEAIQKLLLARAFVDLGYDVSMIVRAIHDDIDETIEGIRVLSAFKYGAGVPLIRFFHPRASGFLRALSKVNADIYYQSPAGALTGLTAAFCRFKRRKFIFRVASDADCVPDRNFIELWRDRKLYEYGLRGANLIAAQSIYQQELLMRNYGLESTVVNMAMELPEEDLDGSRDIDVLWISNLKPVKRPDRLLQIAKRLVDIEFTMIGGQLPGYEEYFAEMEREASMLPNVKFLGHVPYKEVNQYVSRSKILLNTSDVEGFPNTFLQAWARKVPVVSFFDPDEIIVREGFGLRPDTDDEMCSALRELFDDSQKRERIGAAARAFAVKHYAPVVAARQYLESL